MNFLFFIFPLFFIFFYEFTLPEVGVTLGTGVRYPQAAHSASFISATVSRASPSCRGENARDVTQPRALSLSLSQITVKVNCNNSLSLSLLRYSLDCLADALYNCTFHRSVSSLGGTLKFRIICFSSNLHFIFILLIETFIYFQIINFDKVTCEFNIHEVSGVRSCNGVSLASSLSPCARNTHI